MPDLTDQLAALHRSAPDDVVVPETVVAADLRRGRRARVARHRRRLAVAAFAVVVLGAAGAVAAGFGDSGPTPEAAGPTASTAGGGTAPHAAPAGRLVAYTGVQPPGFTVARVPAGYVLQGASDSTLDIAAPRDTTSLDVFVGKLVVTLEDEPRAYGRPVAVGPYAGHLATSDQATTLRYDDGTHHVVIQKWATVDLDDAGLIAFATGVTVTGSAVAGHG